MRKPRTKLIKKFFSETKIDVGYNQFPAGEVCRAELKLDRYEVTISKWRVIDVTTGKVWVGDLDTDATARLMLASYQSIVAHYNGLKVIDNEAEEKHKQHLDRIGDRLRRR